uniref:Uncharacterized protein n=1 Tax=Rhizophora mucronata TaxID=61149 RepID=A0A2P2N531_RHIMU
MKCCHTYARMFFNHFVYRSPIYFCRGVTTG